MDARFVSMQAPAQGGPEHSGYKEVRPQGLFLTPRMLLIPWNKRISGACSQHKSPSHLREFTRLLPAERNHQHRAMDSSLGKTRWETEHLLCSSTLLLQHPKAGNVSRLMVTENPTQRNFTKKKMRRKLFPPTQIISKAILQFPARGSKLSMVQEYLRCLMGLNV